MYYSIADLELALFIKHNQRKIATDKSLIADMQFCVNCGDNDIYFYIKDVPISLTKAMTAKFKSLLIECDNWNGTMDNLLDFLTFNLLKFRSTIADSYLYSMEDIRWSMRVIEFFRNIRNRAKKLVSIGVSYCEAIKTVWQIIKGKISDIVEEVVVKYKSFKKTDYSKVQKTDESGEYRNIMSNRSTKHRLKMSCLERSRSMYNQITLW